MVINPQHQQRKGAETTPSAKNHLLTEEWKLHCASELSNTLQRPALSVFSST